MTIELGDRPERMKSPMGHASAPQIALALSLVANIVLVVFYLATTGLPVDIGEQEAQALAIGVIAALCVAVIFWFHLGRRRADIELQFRLSQLQGEVEEIKLEQRYPVKQDPSGQL